MEGLKILQINGAQGPDLREDRGIWGSSTHLGKDLVDSTKMSWCLNPERNDLIFLNHYKPIFSGPTAFGESQGGRGRSC